MLTFGAVAGPVKDDAPDTDSAPGDKSPVTPNGPPVDTPAPVPSMVTAPDPRFQAMGRNVLYVPLGEPEDV